GAGGHRSVLARIGRLEPAAARLARAVAVLGDECELVHARRLAGVGRDEAARVVAGLVAAGVLADRRPLAFEHPLVRSAVYLDMPAAVRASEHARAAALLHEVGARADQVAGQLLAAEPVGEEWAVAALAEAGHTALARGAPESAVPYLRRALAEAPGPALRAEQTLALGNALARLGQPPPLGTREAGPRAAP